MFTQPLLQQHLRHSQGTVDWEKFNRVADIVSESRSQTRRLVVEVADENGATTTAALEVELSCRNTDEALCEPGSCFALQSADRHCGKCGNSDYGAEDIYCHKGELFCDVESRTPCAGECRNLNARDSCRSCDNNCFSKRDIVEKQTGLIVDQDVHCYTEFNEGCSFKFDHFERNSCLSLCEMAGMTCRDSLVRYQQLLRVQCTITPPAFDNLGDEFQFQQCTCIDPN